MRSRVHRFLGSALILVSAMMGVRPGSDPATAEEPSGRGPRSLAVEAGGLGQGLASLPMLSTARTRSVCAENPTGEKGKGGMAVPDPTEKEYPASGRAADDLGRGWKV